MTSRHRLADGRPSASVVVATHARPQFLKDCVEGIASSLGPEDELIVVESGGNEATRVLSGFTSALTLVHSPHRGKSIKLNAGIRAARGDVVIVTDDDCRVPSDWVEKMVQPFRNPVVGVAFGLVRGLTSVPASSAPPTIPPGPAPPEMWNYAHGASMAVRRRAVRHVGGFDERLGPGAPVHGEEADLVLRLASAGWTCAIADAPAVAHLDWRDDEQSMHNLLVYQRGSGAYLGAALRRDPKRAVKPFLLRLRHEAGLWRDRRRRGWRFGPRVTLAFGSGLVNGIRLPPRRFLDAPRRTEASTNRVRVLWVTDEPPDRNQGGGNIRQAGLLDGICDRIDVTLLLVGHLRDDVTRAKLGEVLEVPTPRRRAPRSLARRRIRDLWLAVVRRRPAEIVTTAPVRRALKPVLGRLADDFDVVVVHHFHLAPLVPPDRHAKWLLHPHNVLSIRAGDELLTEPGRRQRWLLRRQVVKSARYERQAAAAYDGLVFVSDEDATAMAGEHRERARGPVIVVPNGVDLSAFTPGPIPRKPRIVLPASLNYRPNVLGALWFCSEVWPRVQSEVPSACFDLVGREPVDEVLELARLPGVEVHPDVPQIAPWLERARVVVVPLWIGSGTRLKALDAMAAGRPVVGTSIGLQGLGVIDGVQASIADDPSAMADAIAQLLASDATAKSLAAAGRKLVEDHFEWDDLADRFADAVEAVAVVTRAPHST